MAKARERGQTPPADAEAGAACFNYAVSAHKPTAVTHAVACSFTSETALDLIVAKGTKLEVYSMHQPTQMKKIVDTQLFGRVAALQVWRPSKDKPADIFISTGRFKFFLIAYDPHTGHIVTKAKGDSSEGSGRPADQGQIALVDPQGRLVALHIFDGILKVIPAAPNGSLRSEAFNLRFEELDVLDLALLHGYTRPTIVMLSRDAKYHVHLRTYEIQMREKTLADGPWAPSKLEAGATCLLPVPSGGVLVLGENSISYHSGSLMKSCATPWSHWRAHAIVDDSRYLLGDACGWLSVVVLILSERREVVDIRVERLGRTSQASAISYIDAGLVFLGSSQGDSQLLQLSQEQLESGEYFTELYRWKNIGPIVDFLVMDPERQGQAQLICCSGSGQDGSLRIVRNGIGVEEQAQIDLPGVKGVWSFCQNSSVIIGLSFVSSQSRLLTLQGDEIEEVEAEGFAMDHTTLCLSSASRGGAFVQVTTSGANLIETRSLKLLYRWESLELLGSATEVVGNMFCISQGKYKVIAMCVDGSQLALRGEMVLEDQVSCIALRASDEEDGPSSPHATPSLAAVGFWTLKVTLYSIPEFHPMTSVRLPGDVIPCSLLFLKPNDQTHDPEYLLCGMGDGKLNSFCLGTGTSASILQGALLLESPKTVQLGSQPISLSPVSIGGMRAAFAAGDRSTLVHISDGKFFHSSVNLSSTKHAAQLPLEGFADTLAITTERGLFIGTVESMVRRRGDSSSDRLDVRTIPLKEQPRRVAHVESARALAVLTAAEAPSGLDESTNYLRIFDDSTFEIIASHALIENEIAVSLMCGRLGSVEDASELIIVGSAFIKPEEAEPSTGRILVFVLSAEERNLELLHARRVLGAVYALDVLNGYLVAGVNNKLQLLQWVSSAAASSSSEYSMVKELQLKAEHYGHILVLYIAVHNNRLILVGDLMKSITLFEVADNSSQRTLQLRELSRDLSPNWTTAVSFLDANTFVGAENYMNIFVARRPQAQAEDERAMLDIVGEYHLGEFVNRFQRGSLTMQFSDSAVAPLPTILFGTISGLIGVLASIPHNLYTLLTKVQSNLTSVIHGVGGLSHSEWRSFSNERKTVPCHGVIDGDLIESFLELTREDAENVVSGLEVSVEELTRQIEELARLH